MGRTYARNRANAIGENPYAGGWAPIMSSSPRRPSRRSENRLSMSFDQIASRDVRSKAHDILRE
jgi:hypothetical protein